MSCVSFMTQVQKFRTLYVGLRPGGLDYLLRPPMQVPSPQNQMQHLQNQQPNNATPIVLSQQQDHKSVSNPSYFFLAENKSEKPQHRPEKPKIPKSVELQLKHEENLRKKMVNNNNNGDMVDKSEKPSDNLSHEQFRAALEMVVTPGDPRQETKSRRNQEIIFR